MAGEIDLIAELAPKNSGAFALLQASFLRGGFRSVLTIAGRDAVTSDRRAANMHVYVAADDTIYRMPAGDLDDNLRWVAASGGGGGGGGSGWIYIGDLLPQTSETISNKAFQDTGLTILQSATSDQPTVRVEIRASYPIVDVNGTPGELARDVSGGFYSGTVDVSVVGGGDILATVSTPDGEIGALDTMVLSVDTPPAILTLSFTGGYPGGQTELKEGDFYQIQGTTDKAITQVQISDLDAMQAQLIGGQGGTTFTVTGTIADRGTSLQALAAHVAAGNAAGAFGPVVSTNLGGGGVDGVDLLNVNDEHAIVDGVGKGGAAGHAFGITYPASQGALKLVEAATILNPSSGFDTIAYDDPTSTELTITSPAAFQSPKTVNRAGGSFNNSVDNFRITANRAANDADTIVSGVVAIANVAPVIDVTTPAARLRSGGNNGTSPQDHVITITSDQPLLSAPSLAADGGGNRGTFQGGAFVGGPSVWTRSLRVDETVADEKGAFTFGTLVATGLAGLVQNTINSGAGYTLGGFVLRTLDFGIFATTTVLGVEVVDFSKLSAGIFTSTNQTALKQVIGTSPSVTNGYTIDSLGVNPTSLIWLDTPASDANTGGTATITDVQEAV